TVSARVTGVEPLTHDITRLCLTVDDDEPFAFKPGQYVDIEIPGHEGEHRSFSMANLAAEAGELEFMIKRYEGGRFSGLLGEDGIKAGDTLQITGPYGVLPLRSGSPARPASPRGNVAHRAGGGSSGAEGGGRRSFACCGRWPRRASNGPPRTTT